MFHNHMTRIASACARDRHVLTYGGFNIWWRNITKKELSANLYSNRKVCLVGMLSVWLMNDYVRGNQFRKVVHDQSGKDLLGNVLHLFCVKVEQTHSVFEFTERGFNTPAHTIKPFQFIGRKGFRIQICNNGFIRGIGDFKSDNSKRKVIERKRVKFSAGRR